MNKCSQCRFAVPRAKGGSIGDCHRHPPNERGEYSRIVLSTDFCGDWSAQEPLTIIPTVAADAGVPRKPIARKPLMGKRGKGK